MKVSELIPLSVMEGWGLGAKVLIKSPTASGKSYWAQNTIYEYCKKRNTRSLIFSNRNLLKDQNKIAVQNKRDVFDIVNYQNVSEKLMGKILIGEIYDGYEVIVLDEAHFFIEDAVFNRKTDLLLKSLKFKYPDKIIIVMTATPQMLLEYHKEEDFDFVYNLPEDYSHIENIYFYKKENTIKDVLQGIKEGEKAIYFARRKKDAWEMKTFFGDDASFICAVSDKEEPEFEIDFDAMEQIATEQKFSKKILCTTKVLDNGINIVDETVKTIVIDSTSPINIIQSVGRKRPVSKEDKINLYIRNFHGGIFFIRIQECENNLQWVDKLKELGRDEFIRIYNKVRIPDILDNDLSVNIAIEIYYRWMLKFYKKMKSGVPSFSNYILSLFKKETHDGIFLSAEHEVQSLTISEILKKYCGRKIFEEEQFELREKLVESIISIENLNFKKMGINVIKKIIKRHDLSYDAENIRESAGKNRGKTYWFFTEKELQK